ncbi:MAG: transposase [Scytonema sp. RU_4_4]|nr:transposase [Scytonema sp. RU_4_4]
MVTSQLNNNPLIARFQEFRQKLYNFFGARRDSIMDLLDALAGNKEANSIAELSLNPLFRRNYSALCKAIEESFETSSLVSEDTEELEQNQKKDLLNCIYQVIPQAEQRPFYLFAIDTTPYKRPYARTLIERGYIYQPNTIKGNKPINIGHSYSIVSLLPEKDSKQTATWSIPLSGERVPISSNGVNVGSDRA